MVTPEFKQLSGKVTSTGRYTVKIGGKEFIDFSGAAMAVGHNFVQPKELISPLTYLIYRNSYTEQLIERLATISGFENVAFTTSGTEACDAALEMNYGRPYISFEGAYHGLDYITNLVSNGEGIDERNKIVHLKFPNREISDETAIAANDRILRRASKQFDIQGSVVITELIQSDGGINVMTEQFARALKDTLREYNMRLVIDEVYTALGRSGEMLLFKRYGFKPDYVCLGKALGAGFPLGAVLFNEQYPLYKNNLVSMQAASMFTSRVALKVLGKITEERIRYVRETSRYIMKRLVEIESQRIREVRGRGFMIGVDLVNSSGKPDPKYALDVRNRIARLGVVCTLTGSQNNVLKITPPVTAPFGVIERGISIISETLRVANH
ncbi:MAG: aminotransferase class III-fold pyridoxal phosphate-dependent enzyme [Thermoplasmatales archaeon]|nr:aminotransferase class III-fold pyridoxal phosphate-dependent enzyme [Thermoplasmatales archaeon]